MNQKAKLLPTSLFITILFYGTLGQIVADMYIPSLPFISQSLGATAASIQLTLTAFMLGFSAANLIYGPISDRFGRRNPLLTGVAISLLGAVICWFAPSILILVLGRFMQGIGVAACNSVGRSLTRDLLKGNHLAKFSSQLGMIMVFAIATAPTLGGYIQHYFDWRGVFLFLTLYTVLVWLFIWKFLPETNKFLNPEATRIKVIARNYLNLLSSKTFLGYAICVSCAYAGLIAYVTEGPFLFQTVLSVSPIEFGWFSFVTGIAIFLSSIINSVSVMKVGYEKMLLIGNILMFIGGLAMLVCGSLGFLNIFVILIPLSVFSVGAGLAFANGSAGALHYFPKIAGSAGSLFGCMQILGGTLASALMAGVHASNQIPLSMVLSLLGFAALLSWRFLAITEKDTLSLAMEVSQ